eukprot:TRINITY_DN7255_c0_g1_i2.p1 TRINITY_DN7255_c0_g1~~TRINITY_DN7255_c0_g1_i2.p1  ORF type:complete len:114 (-),score=14.55 TRINITY_DN7255_c0_g1_i2:56-397(-)
MVTDDGFLVLASALRIHTNLTHFSLNLSETPASDEGAVSIIETLFDQRELTQLSILLVRSRAITDKTANKIIEVLEAHQKLRNFNVMLNFTDVSEYLLEYITEMRKTRKIGPL